MSPRTGRPKSDNSKGHMLHIRMNDDDLKTLDFCCEELNQSKSELIRKLIYDCFKGLQK